jgi:hypothetical protein
MVMAYGLFQLVQTLSRRLTKQSAPRIADYVFKMARISGRSEYEIFCKSAEDWPISQPMIGRDFKAYLLHQSTPYYVNDYVRKHKKVLDEIYLPPY